MKINDEAEFFRKLATAGADIGFAEAYMDGAWEMPTKYRYSSRETSPMGKLLYHLVLNAYSQELSAFSLRYWAQWGMQAGRLKERIMRFMTTKTEEEDSKNIAYHYDLSNEFFEAMLGPGLAYTCAIYSQQAQTLAEAQDNKWAIIIRKLGIERHHHVLDVGCGWGAFCAKVVQLTGAKCTGVTLSEQQFNYAQQRWRDVLCSRELDVQETGCAEYFYQDYRRTGELYGEAHFDRVAAIGILEHVGIIRNIEFFQAAYQVLKPDGMLLTHYISTTDVYPSYTPVLRSTACLVPSFFSKYVFPGVCIQHPEWVSEAALLTGFELLHSEFYGRHYARTLKEWYDNLVRSWREPPWHLEKTYDTKIFRLYEIYLTMSEAMFRTTGLDLTQSLYYKAKHNHRDKSTYSASFYW
eukprot:CAMPEP_0202687530 /NCGR_PEP_ID=MMETSP1385-20130828/3192_1 /ASSEMBLY_ACC=CAM_ASM_000861 /TAXON_ID=933848 /ORGANISM="Elphidium margaritaceum" /LENGTH=408 /DNA_ID=CAMNT_0049342343 /DNA_START=419 /DNA_END=1642 /DNA_ORIENTATION=+